MRRAAALGLVGLLTAAGCGDAGGEASGRPSEAQVKREVSEVAEAYYDAFRTRDLDAACRHVADRTLASRVMVGANTRDGELPEGTARRPPDLRGCALVRARRRGWEEPLPREAWRVDEVSVDRDRMRARVDTAAEGSYWMRRIGEKWLIVGFGALTDEATREFGGRW